MTSSILDMRQGAESEPKGLPAVSLWPWRLPLANGPRAQDIIAEVAEGCGLKASDLTGRRLTRQVAHARQHAMWEVRRRTPHSLPAIGRIFGGRDHATVFHGIAAHAARAGEGRL